MKEHHWLCTTEIIPPFAQNGTFYSAVVLYKVKRRHCYCTPCSICKREKFDQFNISLNYVYKYPVSIRYFSVAKRFHIGVYAKCKRKCDEMNMCCICRLEEETFWATSWRNQQNDFCAQRRLRSAWASAQSDQSLRLPSSGSLGPNFASGGQRWLWSDWVDAQADRVFAERTDHFVGFVMPWLNFHIETTS